MNLTTAFSIAIILLEYLLLITNNIFFLIPIFILLYMLVEKSWAHAIGLSILVLMIFPGLGQINIGPSQFSIPRINFSILLIIWLIKNIPFGQNDKTLKIRLKKNDSKLWILLLIAFCISAVLSSGIQGIRNVLFYWGFIFGFYFPFSREIKAPSHLIIIGKYLTIGLCFVFIASLYEFIYLQKFYTLIPYIHETFTIYATPVQIRENLGRATVFTQHSSSLSHIISFISIVILFIYDISKKKLFLFSLLIGFIIVLLTQAKTGILIIIIVFLFRSLSIKKIVPVLLTIIILLFMGFIFGGYLEIDFINNIYVNIMATLLPYSSYTGGQAYNTIGRIELFLQFYDWSFSNSIFGIGLKETGWTGWADTNKFSAILFQFGIFGLIFWILFWIKPLLQGFLNYFRNEQERITSLFFILSLIACLVGYFSTYFPEPDFLIMLPFAISSNNYLISGNE